MNGVFNHLLGYVTVALAIPLAAMRYDDLPIKSMIGILGFASISAVALPMGLAYLLHVRTNNYGFCNRAVTTPIALNIATLLHAPLMMVSLIVILSGVIGAAFSPWILKTFHDERASGLALGLQLMQLVQHKHGSEVPITGRYAAFGMAVNGVLLPFGCPHLFCLFLNLSQRCQFILN